ncbi:transglutaminase [Microbacterium sp. Root166]|uniref:transglutaminase domain-containing protein n=1 Tax=Microbacterium sp. Root166 TaxID=1736478 RepID=UPI0006FDB175|nr:transglutaminase domain-containing protein [Microbacterium sp. Root166]KQZ85972.1 transglutaminase [Microbacterium sp. Root166]
MTAIQDAAAPVQGTSWFAPRILAGSLFAGLVVLLAAVAAWPIYRSWQLVVLVAAASAVAAAIAAVARRLRWGGWIVTGVLAATFFLIGIPLAVPSRLGGPAEILRGLGELASGAVLGWKDLVTVELPLGAYRNLLVPALLVFLVGTTVVLLLAWRADRAAYGAVPVALAMVSFGLFFGRTTVSAPLSIGPVVLNAPVETFLGAGGLVVCLLWLAWRTHDERVHALQRAAASSGVRVSRRPSRADRRRTALGAGMVCVALLAAVVVVPLAAQGAQRDVLRSSVEPDIDLSAEVSPLAQYRAQFADGRADEVLFTVGAEQSGVPERVRLATLDAYDGEVYRSGGEGAVDVGRFVRVPSVLDPGPGEPVAADVTIEDLDGVWMPTAGRLARVDFAGDRAASLADRFYYNAAAAAGVQTAGGGLEPGDRYVVHGVEPAAPDLAEIEAPGGAVGDISVPESLRTWMDQHATGSDGAALAGLVVLLRERGYLSHGLTEDSAEWMESLPDYAFQPSTSGHSLARIDQMFTRLLEREVDPRAVQSGNFVAAVGDDEQFAVAVALIARELGFPARVVVGTRLSSADAGLAVCDEGVCRAQDLAAWTEVQSTDGAWVPIDVTPQFEQSPSLDVTEQRDPEVVTEVRPDSVEEVLPPDPVQEDSGASDRAEEAPGLDLAWLWPVLRTTGVVLLILGLALGPFLVIIGAKAARRRARRRAENPSARIAGGWDEFVDAAVDAGREAPRTHTRRELAEAFDAPAGLVLAATADRAVFSSQDETPAEADAYWHSVDEQRRKLAKEQGFWRRLAVTVSLRSFVRQLAPVSGARTRFAERGMRRAPQPEPPMP